MVTQKIYVLFFDNGNKKYTNFQHSEYFTHFKPLPISLQVVKVHPF